MLVVRFLLMWNSKYIYTQVGIMKSGVYKNERINVMSFSYVHLALCDCSMQFNKLRFQTVTAVGHHVWTKWHLATVMYLKFECPYYIRMGIFWEPLFVFQYHCMVWVEASTSDGCVTSTFGYELYWMLCLNQCFSKHCSCSHQGEDDNCNVCQNTV